MRKITFKTIWQRAKIRPVLLLFTFQAFAFSLLLFLPMAMLMNSMGNSLPFVDNVDKIQSNGETANATLISIKPVDNITINGKNPQILTFEYEVNGQSIKSDFCVFDSEKTEGLKTGKTIQIKHLNGASAPIGYDQYTFQMDFMFYIALGILCIGLFLFYNLYRRVNNEISLYKTGKVKEGKIISINHKNGFTFSKFGASSIVHYEYDDTIAKSRTNNFALTNNKSIGDPIRILVSQDGRSSCLYPELISKTNGWKDH